MASKSLPRPCKLSSFLQSCIFYFQDTMDSMRSLNTSLPRSTVNERAHQSSGELLQAFKAAALSVTQLYKTAASEASGNRSERTLGYQEALEDLQDFLDRENLGLGDGEGWQVRQWAVQRSTSLANEVGDADLDKTKRARSTSPALQNRTAKDLSNSPPTSEDIPRSESLPPTAPSSVSTSAPTATSQPRPEIFHFRSNIPAPPQLQDIDMDAQDSNTSTPAVPLNTSLSPSRPIRLEVMQKSSRLHPPRYSNHNRERHSSLRAGVKRKASFIDFFDFGNLNNDESEGGGGGKRGKLQ